MHSYSYEETISVTYVGNNPALEEEGVACKIEVKQLAQSQINMGDFLPSDRLDFQTDV